MNRERLQIGLIATAGLVLAGLGHYFVATQRDVYPIDGYLFYAAAAGCAWLTWRIIGRSSEMSWATLRETLHSAWQTLDTAARMIAATLRERIPQLTLRAVTSGVIGLNVLAALVALLMPTATWLWAAGWLGSLLLVIGFLWPRLSPRITEARQARTSVPNDDVIGEVAEPLEQSPSSSGAETRLNPIGLVVALGLLIAGQLLIVVSQTDTQSAPWPFLAALRLDLPGDANLMLIGWLVLIVGVVAIAIALRHVPLGDYVPLSVAPMTPSTTRFSLRWLIVAIIGLALWIAALRTITAGATGTGGLLPWLAGVSVLAVVWWKIDRVRGVRWPPLVDRREVLALSVAAIAIAVVFTYQLGDVPNSLWGDEGGYWSLARDVATGQVTPDVFGLGTYGFPMGGTLYQSAWLSVFGLNVSAWRLASVGAMLAAALCLYFLVRTTLGKRVAWLSLVALAVMPYALTYARLGYTLSLSLLPVILTLTLLWGAVRHNSQLLAFLAGGATGLAFYTHPSAQLAGLLALAWLIWLLITHHVSRRSIIGLGLVWLLGAVIVASPAITYGLTRAPDDFVGKFGESAFNNLFYARDIVPGDQLAATTIVQLGRQDLFVDAGLFASLLTRGVIRTALSLHTPTLSRDAYAVGALAEPFGLLYLIGLAWCIARFRRPGYAIWAMWLLLGGFVLSAMSSYPPRAGLMVPVVPALAVLSALGLVAGIEVIARVLGGVPGYAKLIGAIGLLIVLGATGLRTYFVELPQRYPPDLENAMFWEAQSMPRGANLMLITADDLPPDYRPWGVREFDLPVAFTHVQPAELDSKAWRVACANQCTIFFRAAERDTIAPFLPQAFGPGTLVEYPDSAGAVAFYRFVVQKS